MRGLISKVEDGGGINRKSHETGFEVEMRPGASSGASSKTDRLTGFHDLIRLYKRAIEV